MADIKKYSPSSGGNLFSDFKVQFSIFRTKRTFAIAYGFVFVFTAFTIFLAFGPSSNSSSPWFGNIFAVSSGGGGDAGPSSSSPTSFSIFSNESYRSRVSSIFSYFFPNSSSPLESHDFSRTDSAGSRNFSSLAPHSDKETPAAKTQTQNEEENHKVDALKPSVSETLQNFTTAPTKSSEGSLGIKNQTVNHHLGDKSEALNQNQTRAEASGGKVEVLKANRSSAEPPNSKNVTLISAKGSSEKGLIQNSTSSLMKKQNTSANAPSGKQGMDDLINSLMNCDLFDGNWVRDDSYPLYKPGSCSLIDEQFNCFLNGRPDNGYHKLKWKPRGCTLPRLNGGHMLETLRGKRLVFVGDSLNRNMWESLICILKNSVKDQKKVYEESGLLHFRGEASYAFIFEEYKCRVEFFVSPFLVQEWEVSSKDGTKKETLRLDMIGSSADKYKNADVIVFNTGHWWTHEKTSKGKDYYQEGSHVYSDLDVNEAFRKALTTWGRWVDANVNPMKSLVFFRGYSASHFSGGQWNSGGQCDHETDPIKNETYLTPYPPKMTVLEKVFKGMKIHVSYMNITRMTDYRKDGHPSIYRKQHLSEEERRSPLSFQDCSHWCLPGVPDAWNEILYSELLVRLNKFRQQQNRS